MEEAFDAGGPGPEVTAEGIGMSNRWAELENGAVVLESERDALKAEVLELRRANLLMAKESSSARAAAVDNEELKSLRSRLDAAQRETDTRLHEIVGERDRAASVSSELQTKIAELASLTGLYQDLQFKSVATELDLVPVRTELELHKKERQAAETKAAGLSAEIGDLIKQRDEAFSEKTVQVARLAKEGQEARAEASELRQASEEAKEGQAVAEQQAADLERRLRELTGAFAEERHAQQGQLAVRDEQVSRLTQLLEDSKTQLAQVSADQQAIAGAQTALQQETQRLRAQLASLEEQLTSRQRAEGAEGTILPQEPAAAPVVATVRNTPLPEGFTGVAELVHQLTSAREEALLQRQARSQLEVELKDLEGEVRLKLPLFADQSKEVARLRGEHGRMVAQSEELHALVQKSEESLQAATERALKAVRTEQILEKHAREMAHQLGLLIEARAPGASGAVTATALAEQNEALRKSVARLTEECETAAQRELQAMREEQDRQASHWRQQLQEKDLQISVLSQKLERFPEGPKDAPAESASPDAAGNAPAAVGHVPAAGPSKEEVKLREQLQQVRAQFTKCVEALHAEARELRANELAARRGLAEARGQLAAELRAGGDAAARAERAASRLKVQGSHLHAMEMKSAAVEAILRREESTLGQVEAQLGQAGRERAQLAKALVVERSKVARLELEGSRLLEERTSQSQVMVDLSARIAVQSDGYRRAKNELKASVRSESALLREQLELSTREQDDSKRSVDELSAALKARVAEVQEARARTKELESNSSKLEAQLAEQEAEVQELRSAGVVRPRRGSELAGEASARLKKRARVQAGDAAGEGLERQLKVARSREQGQAQAVELWKQALSAHEQDLKKQQDEGAQHLELLEKRAGELKALKEELEQSRGQVQGFETQFKTSQEEVATLRASLEQARADALEVEAKAKAKETPDSVEEWRRKHRQAVQEHGLCIAELEKSREQSQTLETANEDWQLRAQELQKSIERLESRSPEAPIAASGGVGAAAAGSTASVSELYVRQLEADRHRLDCESRALRAELSDLRAGAVAAGERLERLQGDRKREQQAFAKLGRVNMLEGENQRLLLEIASLQGQMADLHKDMEAQKAERGPLARDLATLRRKEQDLEKKLEQQTQRPGATPDAPVGRAANEEEDTKWKALCASLGARSAKLLQPPAEAQGQKASAGGDDEELQGMLGEAKATIERLAANRRQADSVKQLHMKKIGEMTRTITELQAKQRSAAPAAPAAVAASAPAPASVGTSGAAPPSASPAAAGVLAPAGEAGR